MKTTLWADWSPDVTMTGHEKYEVVGDLVSRKMSDSIIERFAGKKMYADCIEKNVIAAKMLPFPTIMMLGSLYVFDPNGGNGSYGFEFNPPFELHAWLKPVARAGVAVLDFALPGVILRALKAEDEEGHIVSGIEPFVMAGQPPSYLMYRGYKIMKIAEGGGIE